MAAKKKSKKNAPKKTKQTTSARTSKKKAPARKKISKKTAKKKQPKRPAAKKAAARKVVAKKIATKKTAAKKIVPKKPAGSADLEFPSVRREGRARSGGQSGDLQGLSGRERADSESVDELIEEGNPFEAGVVSGVEAADNADEQEVHTHEFPEDDVPEEYLDKDE
jgi:hypothetical protein